MGEEEFTIAPLEVIRSMIVLMIAISDFLRTLILKAVLPAIIES